MQVLVLETHDLVERVLSHWLAPLDLDETAHLCVSLDAEWNMSRRIGVSIIQLASHSDCDHIYIIPVRLLSYMYVYLISVIHQLHKFNNLPLSLLRLLISDRVFKIGNSIKADLTRIKNQFPQLQKQSLFNAIDLKEHCVWRNIIQRNALGSLDTLLEKACAMYLAKDPQYRTCEEWERLPLSPELLRYAALDVYAGQLIFEKTISISLISRVEFDTAPGTAVVLLGHEGGTPVAYGNIANPQPSSHGSIRVKTPTQSRLLIELSEILAPGAVAILHRLPGQSSSRTKSGSYTLGQLKEIAGDTCVKLVASVSHLIFDQ